MNHRSAKSLLTLLSMTAAGFTLMGFALVANAQEDMIWRKLDPAETVYMRTGEGLVVFELNSRFAPKTVAQFKRLVRRIRCPGRR
jgi:hypothetical protein